MDLDIFYAGDCDITFYLAGMKGGIRDFQLHGMMRVVMKPLITTIPLVGGLQVFFLNNPDIDFDLIGIADLLDMPGLSDILRRIVVETVASMMVLPNKFPIQLSDEIEAAELKAPEPEGVLRVHVVEAKHLMKKDIGMLGKGKSDPYAVITLGAQEFKTKVIDNTVDPKWDFWCEFNVLESDGQQLYLHVMDRDEASDDERLGRATVEVSNIVKKGEDDMWITLEQAKHGMVHLRLTWLTLSDDYSDLRAALGETQLLRVTSMSTALLTIFIDSAKNLPQARSSTKPDPYAVLKVVWEQGFTFLVANPESDTLYLTIIDQKTTNELGQIAYNISKLSKKTKMEICKEPFSLLKSGPESKIVWSMHLRILKRSAKEEEMADAPAVLEREDSRVSTGSAASQEVPPSPVNTQPEPKEEIKENPTEGPQQVEELIEDSSVPQLNATPTKEVGDLFHRSPSSTSSAGVHELGRIQLTLRYSVQRQRLIIVVHKVANIPLKDPSSIPDPYVKLYLLPERAKDTKRKTQMIKDDCNPTFDESFEYVLSQGELNTKQLEVTVASQKQLFYTGSNVLGMVVIDFAKLNLNQPYTAWFDLNPESEYDH
ncbi:C2 domain containing protein [Asbolus verrucosus]|uniref:C2 domain containing protein n=1 Tax=Asbolus verrucosus TaxID=1661398 RepID=A0A482V7D7_ASBVE|nr:C2 domain containing protein [Asbolus verrucosus]